MENIFEATSVEFARSVLPLFSGPQVKIRIESAPCEYTVSKDLLCSRSSYFSAMFEGKFQEGEQQTAILEEVKDVVSVQSFEALLQWLYLGRVKFGVKDPDLQISAIIEFASLADMCSISGMESQMAQRIKEILCANPGPRTEWGQEMTIQTLIVSRLGTSSRQLICLMDTQCVAC
ncbi:hypothetical protein N7510_007950 [Penicillium lagena]|uniref:uncharacterized protein n=1 Tax=Penicillium lagena TaxID=94218 RepID=UPI00253FDF12|nr:uncharacterized protein N7510_007950 [Penicillium lagena]KAJ5611231.1 hypothetical protein N7510_007950 [Penicillium lagena]